MNVALVYIYDSSDERARERSFQFVSTYEQFPPGEKHSTFIVCQHAQPDWHIKLLFDKLPKVTYYQHNDEGWDIGAFIAASRVVKEDIALYCGSTAHFNRSGWMTRIMKSWEKHGAGFYGGKATFEVSPHLNTCGFWTDPVYMTQYPIKVNDKRTRYDFEHGPNAMWKMIYLEGLACKYVTWDDELDWRDWRKPVNGFRRGNQGDCLLRFHHNAFYDAATPDLKIRLQRNTDWLSDKYIGELLNPKLSSNMRNLFTKRSIIRFNQIHQFR